MSPKQSRGPVIGHLVSPKQRRGPVIGHHVSLKQRRGPVIGHHVSPKQRRGPVIGHQVSPKQSRGPVIYHHVSPKQRRGPAIHFSIPHCSAGCLGITGRYDMESSATRSYDLLWQLDIVYQADRREFRMIRCSTQVKKIHDQRFEGLD